MQMRLRDMITRLTARTGKPARALLALLSLACLLLVPASGCYAHGRGGYGYGYGADTYGGYYRPAPPPP
ncbi:MAG: hypothetical protein ABW321_34730, partial [Polyangiales bacterium]